MRNIYSLKTVTFWAAVVTVAVLSSCKKEDKAKFLFTATIESSTKTTININNVTEIGTIAWEQGDNITVFDGNGVEATLSATTSGTTSGFTLDDGQAEPATAPYMAIYNEGGSVTRNTITLSDIQNWSSSSVKAPMYAPNTNSTELVFKNLCGIMVLTLDAPSSGIVPKKVTNIVITANSALCGSFLIDGDDYSLQSLSNSGNNTVTLVCGDGVSIQGSETFYIFLPPATYTSMTITIHTDDGMVCTKTLQNTFTVERNCYYPFSFTLSPVGGINGLFTVGVNADNSPKQIWFSKGNIQYQASTGTWRFAEHQYDYVGDALSGNVYEGSVKCNNCLISNTYSGWIDFFGWGTSGWNSGAVCYQPWSTSTTPSDYYPGGSYTNGLTGYYAEADWAWHNAISNGGNAAHQWRTLTQSEWHYLFVTRTNASDKHGTGNINGVSGLIILPDNWTQPSGCTFISGFPTNSNSFDWTLNSYTLAQWAQMEASGAVFLPASGRRYGTDAGNVGGNSYYWSSTPYSDGFTCGMYFYATHVETGAAHPHYCGFSVRPVKD